MSTRARRCPALLLMTIAGCSYGFGGPGQGPPSDSRGTSHMNEVTSAATKRVLFVCIENSCRSQMADAFARLHGAGRVEVFSAGSRPSGRVNPRAIEFMREIGYDLGGHQSKGLDDLPDVDFDAVVTMGCGDACPLVRAKQRLDWNIPDPKDMPADEFRRVRDIIENRVNA